MKLIKAILLSLLTVAAIFIVQFTLIMFPNITIILIIIFCVAMLTILWYNSLDDKDKEEED